MVLAVALVTAAISYTSVFAFEFNHFFNVTYGALDRLAQFGDDQYLYFGADTKRYSFHPPHWVTTFSDSITWVPGAAGQGTPSRSFTTLKYGSSPGGMDVLFAGSAVWIYGNWSDLPPGSITYINGTSALPIDTAGKDVLNFTTNGKVSRHRVGPVINYMYPNRTTVTVTSFVVTWGVQSNGDPNYNISDHAQTEPFMNETGRLNSFYTLRTAWENMNRTLGTDPATKLEYPHLNLIENSVSFSTPKNANFMTIKGAVGPDSGGFTVGLDPSNPLAYSGGDPFSANEQWFSPAVLYALPLDPAVQYHITVNSVDYVTLPNATEGTGSGVRLHSVTFYSAGGTDSNNNATTATHYPTSITGIPPPKTPYVYVPPKKSSAAGPIAGGVVGGVVGVALVCLIVFLLLLRRKKLSEKSRTDVERFDIDPVVDPELTPFPSPVRPALRTGHDEYELTSTLGGPITTSTATSLPSTTRAGASPFPNSRGGPDSPKNLMHTPAPRSRTRIEEDAGDLDVDDDDEEILPPTYDPQWQERRLARRSAALNPEGSSSDYQSWANASVGDRLSGSATSSAEKPGVE